MDQLYLICATKKQVESIRRGKYQRMSYHEAVAAGAFNRAKQAKAAAHIVGEPKPP